MSIEIIVERGSRWQASAFMGGNSPAIARCTCGAEVELRDPLDNVCDACDKCYNLSGQEVIPSWECDDQGEPYDIDY